MKVRAGWSLLVGGAAGFAVLALYFVMSARSGQVSDDQAMLGMGLPLGRKPLAEKALRALALGVGPAVILAAAAVGLRRRRPWLSAAAVLTAVLTFGGARALKMLVPRPQFGVGLPDNTLPSGHTAMAVGAGLAAIIVSSRSWRSWVRRSAQLANCLVAFMLIGVTYHRPSDVIASLCVGAMASGVVALLWAALESVRQAPIDRRGIALLGTPTWRLFGELCGVGAVALVLMLVAGWRPTAGDPSDRNWAWTSVVLVIAVSALLLSTVRRRRASSPKLGSGRRRVVGRRV